MTLYAVLKTLHLFSMVAWFAGMIGMFRVFALHTRHAANKDVTDVLKDVAAWRYKVLANPGMIGVWVCALAMIGTNPAIMKGAGWLHAKILIVFLLSGFMGFIGKARKRYAADDTFLDEAQCGRFNMIILTALLVILCLAVLRPF